MRKLLGGLATAALLAWPALAPAEDKPEGSNNPLFSQLDANNDGQVGGDEIPEDKKRIFESLLRKADKNSDGKLSREEFDQASKETRPDRPVEERAPEGRAGGPGAGGFPPPGEILSRLDRNSDGKITADEVPGDVKERFEKLVAMADKDKDGAVSREELETAARNFNPGQGGEGNRPNPEAIFKMADKNGDGKITSDEVPEDRRPMIERADKDGDKAVTKDEFVAFFAAQIGRRPEGRPDGAPRPEGRPEGRPDGGPRPDGGFRPNFGIFGLLDKNQDQVVDAAEIEAAPDVLRKLDKDGDGKITPREIFGEGFRRPDGDRPDARPEGGRPEGRRPDADRPRGEGDKPRAEGDRPRGEGDRPRGEGDRPRPERRPDSDK